MPAPSLPRRSCRAVGKLGRLGKRRARRRRHHAAVGGRCVVETCERLARSTIECKLCEQKGRAHRVVACPLHALAAREQMKGHVLRKHPGAWPAWLVAMLRGDAE